MLGTLIEVSVVGMFVYLGYRNRNAPTYYEQLVRKHAKNYEDHGGQERGYSSPEEYGRAMAAKQLDREDTAPPTPRTPIFTHNDPPIDWDKMTQGPQWIDHDRNR